MGVRTFGGMGGMGSTEREAGRGGMERVLIREGRGDKERKNTIAIRDQ